MAAMKNAARLTGRDLKDLRVVVSGAGASGVAVSKIILEAGIGDIAIADSKGIIHKDRTDLTAIKARMAGITNRANFTGTIEEAMVGADVFIGLDGPFRFRRNGVIERALEVREVTANGVVVVSPAPTRFGE